MTKLPLLSALTSSALLALSAVPASAQVLEPAASAFAAAAAAGKPIYELPYSDARAVLAGVQADRVAASAPTTTQDMVWNIGPTGAVRVRIVRPSDAQGSLPAVLYYHGGGWVMGDRKTHD
ncbi:MAG: lipase, partial [Betaproteobacteria bacterium]|nr:lipase [Betaproteobacteria bacterium]